MRVRANRRVSCLSNYYNKTVFLAKDNFYNGEQMRGNL